MHRRSFLGCCATILPAVRTGVSDSLEGDHHASTSPAAFPYRGWSFCVYSHGWDMLEAYVSAALERARDYGINTFELHDYNIGQRGLVDAAVNYEFLPKLAIKGVLTYGAEHCTRAQKAMDYDRLRNLCRKVKSAGLKLNVWYHVLRDAPKELFSEYPEMKDIESGFYWAYLDKLLLEFFQRLPEVDRVTITSLHETPSVLAVSGALAKEQRLLSLYNTLYRACRCAGKDLIIRDFIVKYEDFESFWNILAKLPPEIYVMTKEVLADWTHLDMPVNPFLPRYRGRKVIVEFDLYGEYWGRLDLPACYPEYIHRQIRTIKSFDVCGAVGRVVHENERSPVFKTIFESPNEVNCYAFSRLLSKPLPWLGPGQFTDPREKPGRWGWDLDAFDKKIWMEWASGRYGRKAAVRLIRALSRTDKIVRLVTDIGGRGFQAHSWVPGARWVPFLWEPFVDQVRMLGMDFLRDEKREATRMAGCCLEDVRAAERVLSKEDYEKLTAVFEGEIVIIRAYEAVLEGYYQVYLAQQGESRSGLETAAHALSALALEVSHSRGETFFGGLPNTLREMGEFVREGKPPASIAGS